MRCEQAKTHAYVNWFHIIVKFVPHCDALEDQFVKVIIRRNLSTSQLNAYIMVR